ncbi:hypothetical protein GCM10009540_77630 [Streptomyces turgidiscabies]
MEAVMWTWWLGVLVGGEGLGKFWGEGVGGWYRVFLAPAAPTRPIPYLGAAPPDPPPALNGPCPQTPDGLEVLAGGKGLGRTGLFLGSQAG